MHPTPRSACSIASALSAMLVTLLAGPVPSAMAGSGAAPPLPAGNGGIAADFPADVGIEEDPRVVFVEMFEDAALDAVWDRWEQVREPRKMSFSDEVPPGSAGRQSLVMQRETGDAPSLYRRIANEDGGYGHDRLFLRYYVRFHPDTQELHHGVSAMGGNHPPQPYPVVRAGRRPDPTRAFWSGIETYGEELRWDYYTYWTDMIGSPPEGATWGNSFIQDPDLTAERGQWICIEHMIRINDPDDTNGEQALWINGELVSHVGQGFPRGMWIWGRFYPNRGGEQGFRWTRDGREPYQAPEGGDPFPGFRWRTADTLNVNFIWLYLYTERPPGHYLNVAFDHVVVATQYIGPIETAP